jgi:hypothetical protein
MTSDQPTGTPAKTPSIRGQERADVVDDLARGDQTHVELATKYERALITIKCFSAAGQGLATGHALAQDLSR